MADLSQIVDIKSVRRLNASFRQQQRPHQDLRRWPATTVCIHVPEQVLISVLMAIITYRLAYSTQRHSFIWIVGGSLQNVLNVRLAMVPSSAPEHLRYAEDARREEPFPEPHADR